MYYIDDLLGLPGGGGKKNYYWYIADLLTSSHQWLCEFRKSFPLVSKVCDEYNDDAWLVAAQSSWGKKDITEFLALAGAYK